MESDQQKNIVDADKQIRDYYENEPPSETESFPIATETVSISAQRDGTLDQVDDERTQLSGGDLDASPQGLDAGTETPGGTNPTPDQDVVEEIGEAVGVTYQDNEPLSFGEKAAARDEVRWELNPASSEDYQERQALLGGSGPQPASPGKGAKPAGSSKARRRKQRG